MFFNLPTCLIIHVRRPLIHFTTDWRRQQQLSQYFHKCSLHNLGKANTSTSVKLHLVPVVQKLHSTIHRQRAERVVSDSQRLMDFAIRLVNSVFNLPDGQVMFFEEKKNSNNRRTVKSILLVKKFLGLVEMTSGLVNASFSLPEWQAVKMIFFAPCTR